METWVPVGSHDVLDVAAARRRPTRFVGVVRQPPREVLPGAQGLRAELAHPLVGAVHDALAA